MNKKIDTIKIIPSLNNILEEDQSVGYVVESNNLLSKEEFNTFLSNTFTQDDKDYLFWRPYISDLGIETLNFPNMTVEVLSGKFKLKHSSGKNIIDLSPELYNVDQAVETYRTVNYTYKGNTVKTVTLFLSVPCNIEKLPTVHMKYTEDEYIPKFWLREDKELRNILPGDSARDAINDYNFFYEKAYISSNQELLREEEDYFNIPSFWQLLMKTEGINAKNSLDEFVLNKYVSTYIESGNLVLFFKPEDKNDPERVIARNRAAIDVWKKSNLDFLRNTNYRFDLFNSEIEFTYPDIPLDDPRYFNDTIHIDFKKVY